MIPATIVIRTTDSDGVDRQSDLYDILQKMLSVSVTGFVVIESDATNDVLVKCTKVEKVDKGNLKLTCEFKDTDTMRHYTSLIKK